MDSQPHIFSNEVLLGDFDEQVDELFGNISDLLEGRPVRVAQKTTCAVLKRVAERDRTLLGQTRASQSISALSRAFSATHLLNSSLLMSLFVHLTTGLLVSPELQERVDGAIADAPAECAAAQARHNPYAHASELSRHATCVAENAHPRTTDDLSHTSPAFSCSLSHSMA